MKVTCALWSPSHRQLPTGQDDNGYSGNRHPERDTDGDRRAPRNIRQDLAQEASASGIDAQATPPAERNKDLPDQRRVLSQRPRRLGKGTLHRPPAAIMPVTDPGPTKQASTAQAAPAPAAPR